MMPGLGLQGGSRGFLGKVVDSANEVQLHYVMVDLLEVRQAAGTLISLVSLFRTVRGALIYTISFHTSGHIKPIEHLLQAHKINRFKPRSDFKAHGWFLYEFPLWCVQGEKQRGNAMNLELRV